MIITRDFNASTARQNEAVDAVLSCGLYPSNIRLNNFDVEMQYNYKDMQYEDFELVIRVYPSGQYKVIDCDEACDVCNLRQVVEHFREGIAHGFWFEFNYQDNFTEEQIKNVIYLLLQDIKPTTMIKFGGNAHLYYNFHWYDDEALQSWTKYHVTILPDGNMEYYYPERWFTNNVVEIVYDAIVAVHKMYSHKTFENKEEENKTMNNVMTMSDAVAMVLSDDYKERLIAEYVEAKIRYERLHNTIIKWCAGKADFVTDIELLEEQAKHMGNYLKMLEIRAVKEDIELPAVDWRK